MTAPLPAVSQNLTIQGSKATLELSPLPATAQFSILTVAAGNLAADGGGIDINSLNGTQPIVTGDTFTGNSATAAGGIANEGEATVTVTGSTFLRNAAVSAGGAVYNQCVAVVTGTTFDQNTARSGGGGAIEQEAGCFGILSTILPLSLTRSQVLGNSAGTDGGGIDNPAAIGTVTLTATQVRGNSARSSGGGIYTSGPGSVTLTSSRVQANRPDNCAPADSVPGCTG